MRVTVVPASEEVRPRDGREPRRWAWFLHGIFGRGRNWRSVARRLVEATPRLGARLVDLRLHGDSTDAAPPHTLKACVDDLVELSAARAVPAPDLLLGHSFGGKVALEAARRAPGGWSGPGRIWVVDASPSAGEPGGDALRMLEVLRGEPGPFAGRDEAVETLRSHGFPPAVGRWMATNLREEEDGWRWGLDLDGLEALLDDFFRTDLWEVVEAPPEGVELHVVVAEGSEVVAERECRRIAAAAAEGGRVHLHRLPGGHWLNVSNPDGLVDLVKRRTPR